MNRPTQRQIAKFEAELQSAARNSVRVTDRLLAELAQRRDIHLANLR